MKDTYDFGGYATKANLKCTDGRVILSGAFKESDKVRVPLVWHHMHDAPSNVLGHAVLENREDGVYAYGKFNDTPAGVNAKALVLHGDIVALSIYANQLIQKGKEVIHGTIREVSLVMAGANPGALIDNLTIQHSDGTQTDLDDEAVIFTGENLEIEEPKGKKADINHADNGGDETISDVFNTLSDKQKDVVYIMIAEAIDSAEGDSSIAQSGISNDKGDNMKVNVFDKQGDKGRNTIKLTQEQFDEIMTDAQRNGSFRDSFLAHAVTYGIENIDYLFPDAQALSNTPAFVQRRMEWVGTFMNGTNHNPFSRIKTLSADITLDTARAKGYVKGSLKKEEFFALSRRITTPQTVYKKQKLDRDDIIDITDLDVVAWMKSEMRVMLDEEVARAALVGDGREADDEDKIIPTNIRPIWTDDDFFSHKVQITDTDATADLIIEAIIRARKNYKGSGNPTMFVNSDLLTDMLLVKDEMGRRLYSTQAELEAVLRVSKIVEVEVMDNQTRETGAAETLKTWKLLAIMLNLKDYTFGADRGGNVSMFEDFDIDYNQQKYLLETRLSGALTLPKSALVVEIEVAAG